MHLSVNIHADHFTAVQADEAIWIKARDGGMDAAIFLATPAAADELIKAAVAAKDLLLGRTSEPVSDSLSRAIAADVDEQTGRVWAVFEETEWGTVEVTDPKTRADALVWAEVNALTFAGPLYVGRARTGLDAQLTPPAEPGRDTDRPPTGYQLPDARCDGEWRTGTASGQCTGLPEHQGQCMDKTGHRWLRASVRSDA